MVATGKRQCTRTTFGSMPDGRKVDLFTLTNHNGVTVTITAYGAAVVSIIIPDKNGDMGDIILGFDSLAGYLQKGNPFFGSTIGRFANRIARGKFTLNGKEYTLAINNGVNHLHGGPGGFDKVLWQAENIDRKDDAAVTMSYESPDGEEGYPGAMKATVAFQLTDNNELRFDYHAEADADTVVNLTNHTYFNLNGQGDILDHLLRLNASSFTPIDATQIPTGELRPVAGTPFDFTRPEKIGSRIDRTDDEQIVNGLGYDHNFVCSTNGSLSKAAAVYSPASGRLLEVLTTEPGIQFYSGNFLDGTLTGKRGVIYKKRGGFCLETQHFPDSPNQKLFPSVVLKAGTLFKSTTINRFSVADGIS
ncbi:MAG: galactose mutarotase [Chitinispirillaceae bacterium]|nr:galactose mutarotase [Chitinispirillaceae bacterium]